MSEEMVTLTIDGMSVTVEKGTLLVDAAKRVGVEIPVFCYHPKLHSVGMCRMCLVEVGRPSWDRAKGEAILDENGNPVISFNPNLETACTLRVDDGWVVNVNSEKAIQGRREVVEFLLTSHPLDCPICDKGGECPLQDLTMEHGPGKSRFLVDDKSRAQKHVPLGDLIFLDRERCIQCARCVRFQDEIVDDPVLGFSERGRKLEIVTFSTPGFDSYFSGNTTDICPVGALTTADFRFGARPWELNAAASICPHCPVGCNIVLNTRREAKSGGEEVVKRVMPRQNEYINEIWICDKGRFAYHFALSEERISQPLVRKGGKLEPASWDEALTKAAEGIKAAGDRVVGITGGRASNEDLFNFRKFIEGVGGKAYLHEFGAGGYLVQQVGVGTGTNLGDLSEEDVVVVVATDLIEEAPIWWLRVKQAVERGTTLIVINAWETRLDKHAAISLRTEAGSVDAFMLGMLSSLSKEVSLSGWKPSKSEKEAIKAIKEAQNLVIFFGSEGLGYDGSLSLVQSCASILAATDHVGGANNGLIPVWKQNNTQGAWDMGLDPLGVEASDILNPAEAVFILAADPIGDQTVEIPDGAFVVVQELFHTDTVEEADVVFPASSFLEREGTYTSGERIVQRFYPAVAPFGEGMPDWKIIARLGEKLGLDLVGSTPAMVMEAISDEISDYAEVSYQALLNSELQWPLVGDEDKYFGGTAYKNDQGLGIHLTSATERGEEFNLVWSPPEELQAADGTLIIPVSKLLDSATTMVPSDLLNPRLAILNLWMNPEDISNLGIEDGAGVKISWNGKQAQLPAVGKESVPKGSALVPRSRGIPLHIPTVAKITPATE